MTQIDYKQTDADYGSIESIVLSHPNGHDGFIDSDPTMMYIFRVRDAAQARKIFAAYRHLYHNESLQHVLRHVSVRGNRLHLSTEGLSKLEKCARIANVHINPKNADIIRR